MGTAEDEEDEEEEEGGEEGGGGWKGIEGARFESGLFLFVFFPFFFASTGEFHKPAPTAVPTATIKHPQHQNLLLHPPPPPSPSLPLLIIIPHPPIHAHHNLPLILPRPSFPLSSSSSKPQPPPLHTHLPLPHTYLTHAILPHFPHPFPPLSQSPFPAPIAHFTLHPIHLFDRRIRIACRAAQQGATGESFGFFAEDGERERERERERGGGGGGGGCSVIALGVAGGLLVCVVCGCGKEGRKVLAGRFWQGRLGSEGGRGGTGKRNSPET